MGTLTRLDPFYDLRPLVRGLQEEGVDRNFLAEILRKDPHLLARSVAEALLHHMPSQEDRGEYERKYPERSIKEQVGALLDIPAFEALNADWVIHHGDEWFKKEQSKVPQWEVSPPQPLVYVSPRGWTYTETLEKVVNTLSETHPHVFKVGINRLVLDSIQQSARTRTFENELQNMQSGDFLVIPFQLGEAYQGWDFGQLKGMFEIYGQFGVSSVAMLCYLLSHPWELYFGMSQALCLGDELPVGKDTIFLTKTPSLHRSEHDGAIWFGSEVSPPARMNIPTGILPKEK